MDRNTRAAIWRDELAHPTSPTTQAAMMLSEANRSLVEEWVDLDIALIEWLPDSSYLPLAKTPRGGHPPRIAR